MSRRRIGIALATVSLLSLFWIVLAQAQVQGEGWSEPYRLSSEAGKASEGYCVADQYGYVHCFWTETLFEDQQSIIQYARFDGVTWSTPNDIYMTGIEIGNVSPVVDQQGTLHIAWAEGLSGPVYYTHAPANDALSAQNWAHRSELIFWRTHFTCESIQGAYYISCTSIEPKNLAYIMCVLRIKGEPGQSQFGWTWISCLITFPTV